MNTRETILDIIREQLGMDEKTLAGVNRNGRLGQFTAVDSLFMVELVMTIEERFGIEFKPEDIDDELIGNLDRLTDYVESVRESRR